MLRLSTSSNSSSPIRRRVSRVSFASSVESIDDKGVETTVEETQDLPPSPSRGRSNRSTYSFGLRLSLGGDDTASETAEAPATPTSPPQSPGQLKDAWAYLKRREEDMESKQRELEEWDFELKEEKRQHRESRLFLARKMSELEAREHRAACGERRLSTLSGTTASSVEWTPPRTPPSGTRLRTPSRDTPEQRRLSGASTDTATQTEQTEEAAADKDVVVGQRCRRATGICKRLFKFFMVAKVFLLIGVVVVPALPRDTVETIATWLPVSLEPFLVLDAGSDDSENGSAAELVEGLSQQGVAPSREIHSNAASALPEGIQEPNPEHVTERVAALPDMPSPGSAPPVAEESQPTSLPWGWKAPTSGAIAVITAIASYGAMVI